MGMYTQFTGNLTTSRPLTCEELAEYNDSVEKYELEMYLVFVYGSANTLEGLSDHKICGYLDMEQGFINTVNWMKAKGISLTGRINYAYEDVFSEIIGGGLGAFVVTPENVTYHKLDLNELKMVSDVIYLSSTTA
jgi:hypothetical protein